MPRKLASVVRVDEILPIPNADAIELARIKGWQCVVKKGEFKHGDLAVYLEIDAVPPDVREFSWLWQPKTFKVGDRVRFKDREWNIIELREEKPDDVPEAKGRIYVLEALTVRDKTIRDGTRDEIGDIYFAAPAEQLRVPRPERYRIRTIRLRGCVSQGLLVPVGSVLSIQFFDPVMTAPAPSDGCPEAGLVEGIDLTERLGVTKYEPPMPQGGDLRGPFPPFAPKTDETRVQSAPEVLEELVGKPYVVTLKCDGTSVTFGFHKGEFHVCSRNYSLAEGANLYWHMARKYNIKEMLEVYSHLVVQGEIVGPNIAKNLLGLTQQELRVFSIYDQDEGRYLPHTEVVRLCDEVLNLPLVPVLLEGDAFPEFTVDLLLKLAEGKYPRTSNEREGIVIRPRDEELFSTTLMSRLSFKVISNRYLLAEKD